MKTKLIFLLPLLSASLLIFSFCGTQNDSHAQSNSLKNETEELDTALDKYVGLYQFMKYKFSVGQFPENSMVHTDAGGNGKYLPLDKKHIGKYFLVEDGASYDTKRFTDFVGGYIAPTEGNILLGVDKDGTINIQNFNNFGKIDGATMDFNLSPKGKYGRFVLRSDGKYNLVVNNATYEWRK
jgi:hypothetical protein